MESAEPPESAPQPPSGSPFLRSAKPWLLALRDLLWPPSCFACESYQVPMVTGQAICQGCLGQLQPIRPPFCRRCGEPFGGQLLGTFVCGNCEGRGRYHMDFAIAGYEFSGALREMIHSFKFERRRELRFLLGWLATKALDDPRIAQQPDWILVPVPLHGHRRRERGFNQSAEIARVLAHRAGLPFSESLRRLKETPHQSRLSRQERLKNLKGAFEISPKALQQKEFAGKHVLIVDDVLTTGATVDECARVLKKAGHAATVAAVTVARG